MIESLAGSIKSNTCLIATLTQKLKWNKCLEVTLAPLMLNTIFLENSMVVNLEYLHSIMESGQAILSPITHFLEVFMLSRLQGKGNDRMIISIAAHL